MRPKFVFGVFLVGAALIAAILLKQHPKTLAPQTITASTPVPAAAVTPEIPLRPPPAPAPAPVVAQAMTPEDIQAEKNRLSDWEMNNDPQSLSNILADLHSPEKEIRMAAIEATVQFDDTNAAPILREVATNTEDPYEKVALLNAADFLALPAVTFAPGGGQMTPQQVQAAQQRQAQYQADKQARIQQQQQGQGQGQGSGGPSSQ